MASSELDLVSGVPLYRQIMEILRAEILSGEASPNEPMTEAKLLDRFDVSRAPIRQALRDLTSEGYVYRKQGKGTFPVTGARVERPADLKPGFLYNYLADRGLHPTSTVSGIERAAAPAAVARRLGLAPGELLLHFQRVLSIEGRPFAENDIYIRAPEDFQPQEVELVDGGSAFALLERGYGITLDRAEHEAWATSANAAQAALLGIDPGSPLLMIDTVFYARGGVAVGWRSAAHLPEDFKYNFVTQA